MQWFVEREFKKVRYARLKRDIEKLKYEKLSKYRFKQPKCIVLGTPKKPEKGQQNIIRKKIDLIKNHQQYITEILCKKMTQIWPKGPFLKFPIKCKT